ncbi:MAG: 3-hydroxyacyl-CoA dehydrogenase NAD-binding domain-containing protein [Gammaproteobacteria bacterium]|nr:3-hydroxyacyl-CoA dehydrogenase NAD-binding domain-containing protein [Gammaproteobacteria bacterium]MCZ6911216.1 3-hydroxyacyl-CoA dehydrogenase NAD-binding domain-containing protein [Pseudomonadota bacterium]
MSEPVTLARHGQVAVITIDNPPVNALSHAVRKGIGDRLAEAGRDDAVNAVVVHCTGRTFIAGADIREFGKPPQDPSLREVLAQLDAFRKPTVAAIHGTALGGGLETALCCHYRVAAGDAKLGLPEVKLGLLPGSGGTQRLPRLIGAERALDMITGGKPVDAATALSWGVIDVCTDTNLLTAAISFAEQKSGAEERPRISEREVAKVEDGFFSAYRKKIARRTRDYEAPERIVQCVEAAASLSFEDGMRKERELFRLCRDSKQSASMRYLFFAERQVARVPDVPRETPTREINNVAVVGAGTMGAGIALSCLNASLDVSLLDKDRQGLERGRATIEKLLAAAVGKGRITDIQMQEQLSRLRLIDDYQTLSDADLVIEAVFESMAIKEEVFSTLDRVCRDGAILASNTSTLDIDRIAAATSRPEDVIGLHFFSPANVMKLLEIVRGEKTSADVIASSMRFARQLSKIGVLVGNCFGFVGNRMLYGYGRENQFLLLEGAPPEYIDRVLTDWGMAMGPNAVGDLAGLDVGFKVRQERTDLPDDPRYYRVADMLAEQGRYGQKTGRGIYLYEEGSRKPIPDPEVSEIIRREAERLGVEQREIGKDEIIERCIYALVLEGARILEDGLAMRASDIDVVWANGYGFPRYRGGPMFYADTIGVDRVHDAICRFRERFGTQYWSVPGLLEKLARDGDTFAGQQAAK